MTGSSQTACQALSADRAAPQAVGYWEERALQVRREGWGSGQCVYPGFLAPSSTKTSVGETGDITCAEEELGFRVKTAELDLVGLGG